jgi:CO/xanthine dehydrogenase FAD-binding subunit
LKRLKPFVYFEPATLKEAFEIAADKRSATYFLAGGTDLFVRMKRGEIAPSVLVNLKRINGLNRIEGGTEGGLRIGALVKISEIEHSPRVLSSHPVLVQATALLGSPSIRNLGTLGGNIGRASPASDIAPSLMVLRARVMIDGPQGKRDVDVEHLFSEPGRTTLSSTEIITSFFLPEMAPRTGTVYLKLGRREGMDCALVGVATSVTLSGKHHEAEEVKVALASMGPVPLRSKSAEEVLLSGPITDERLKKAAQGAAEDSSPITDMRASGSYRKEMVKVLTYRALLKSLHLAQGEKEE